MSIEAIASNTAAAYSSAIPLAPGDTITVYCTPALDGAEQVKLEVSYDDGTSWVKVSDPQFKGDLLQRDRNLNTVGGFSVIRLWKSATASATTVYYD